MILLLFVLVLVKVFQSLGVDSDFNLLTLSIFFLFIGVHITNLLYNIKLLKVYNDAENTTNFSKSLSVVLLILYTLGGMFNMLLIIAAVYEALDIYRRSNLLNPYFLGVLVFMFILVIFSIWIIILQIKLLRLLKHRQLTKADELLQQLGADAENLR